MVNEDFGNVDLIARFKHGVTGLIMTVGVRGGIHHSIGTMTPEKYIKVKLGGEGKRWL